MLTPQELRNALFKGRPILTSSIDIAEAMNDTVEGEVSDLIRMKVITPKKFERMHDVQFATELLFLAIKPWRMTVAQSVVGQEPD